MIMDVVLSLFNAIIITFKKQFLPLCLVGNSMFELVGLSNVHNIFYLTGMKK